jgi:hypothetical protein
MSSKINGPWFYPVPESTVEKLLNPIAEPIGQGIGGLASIIMNPMMKLGVISKHNMENFDRKIMEKNNNIPEKNRDVTKQGLALKALEDSVYQLDSETLQDMFATLIASSLDNRKNENVLPSFSSILKDLSAEDALLLNKLYKLNAVSTADIKLTQTNGNSVLPCLENIMLFDDGSHQHQPVSINTLSRLGLISLHKTSLIQPNFALNYELFRKEHNQYHDYANKQIEKTQIGTPKFDKFSITEGYITMTNLGKIFGRTVIDQ